MGPGAGTGFLPGGHFDGAQTTEETAVAGGDGNPQGRREVRMLPGVAPDRSCAVFIFGVHIVSAPVDDD